jgi:cobalt-zinc-cadmium efflux system outer membrane protein
LAGGNSRNFNDRENQATYQVSVPLPVWNRNQGNIRAAQAELGRAIQEVSRVQNELTGRLWTAYGHYAAARQRAERYRTAILPNATKTYRLSQEAFRGGQFEYLRVLQAQRAAAEANLEYIRTLGEAWRAASEIAGLLLEN